MKHSGSYSSLRFMWEYHPSVWTKCMSDLCRHSGLCNFFPFNLYVVDLFITSSLIGHDDRLSAILCMGAPKHLVQQSMLTFCTLSPYKATTWRLQTWVVHVCLCVCVCVCVCVYLSRDTAGVPTSFVCTLFQLHVVSICIYVCIACMWPCITHLPTCVSLYLLTVLWC